MTKQISTSITINYSQEKIWKVLISFNEYEKWNTLMHKVEGTLGIGEKLKIEVGKMKFAPVVLNVEEHTCFSWKGVLGMKGIFDGTHSFELKPNKDSSTEFIHCESFKGILVLFFCKEDRQRNKRRI